MSKRLKTIFSFILILLFFTNLSPNTLITAASVDKHTPTVPQATFTFDPNIVAFTAVVGTKVYNLTKEQAITVAENWSNYDHSYKVPFTDITLYRTTTPYLYKVSLEGYRHFRMKVDIAKRKATFYNAPKICVKNIVRVFKFPSGATSCTLKLGCKTYYVTIDKINQIASDWPNYMPSYNIPGTDITLYRTFSKYIYNVKVGCDETFTMLLDPVNRIVTLLGGESTNFIYVENIQ